MMLLLVGVMRATIVWRGWALPTQDEMLGFFSCGLGLLVCLLARLVGWWMD